MTPLEQELIELGGFLDHGDGSHLLTIREQRYTPSPWARPVRIAAVIVIVIGVFVGSFAPARRAVARWFGIGAVRIVPSPTTLPDVPTTAVPSTSVAAKPPTVAPDDPLADARSRLAFTPLVAPASAGPVKAVEVDDSLPGGLLIVRYLTFSLVEVSSRGEAVSYMAKVVDTASTSIEDVRVNGTHGVWLSGAPHQIAYLDSNGEIRVDTVRREGNVLLWTKGLLTLRIEGLADKADALAMAETI
jgi:hypothetical protein